MHIKIISDFVIAIIDVAVDVAAQSAFENIPRLNFDSLGTFINFVANLGAVITNIIRGFIF
jgi:hypothetical protein